MKILEITSTQNDLVKYAVKLQDSKFRRNEKMVLVDGAQTIDGLIQDEVVFEYIFLKKDNSIKENVKANNLVFVTEEILKKISTTKSPTNVVGIIKEPKSLIEDFVNYKKIALIDGIKDAGNLGTIIRSAVAFSIDGIILFGNCVDLYNSKVIRATAQNIFKIPIVRVTDIRVINEFKKTHKIISTVVDSKNDFMDVEFDDNFIITFGSEADGLSDEIIKISDKKVSMFMDNNVESLNLGVCASIAFAFIMQKNKSK